jgi:hypothetical protein
MLPDLLPARSVHTDSDYGLLNLRNENRGIMAGLTGLQGLLTLPS